MRSLSTRAAGLLILVLGAWGALVPFVGPYFHFTLGPTRSWTWTSGRLWLDVLPGIVAVVGGLMLLGAGPRPAGKVGALLAAAAGIWFAIGPDVSLLWKASGAQGAAHGSKGIRALEAVTYHTGLGAVIAFLAGYALPGFLGRRAAVTEAGAAGGAAAVGRERPPVGHRLAPVEREPVAVGAPTSRAPAAPPDGAELDGAYGNGGPPASGATAPASSASPSASSATAPSSSASPSASSASAATTSEASSGSVRRRRRQGGLLSRFRS